MKSYLIFSFLALVLILDVKSSGAKTVAYPITGKRDKTANIAAAKINVSKTSLKFKGIGLPAFFWIKTQDSVTQLLRLKLIIDSLNYDDILIGFNSGASAKYNGNEDSEYWPGMNAPVSLSSFSSDGFQLSQNYLPLPKQTPLIIRLDVEAEYSGAFDFERTELDPLPEIYEVWLVDSYKKDSLDLRVNASYNFTIDKADTSSFGKNRFYVVVRQNAVLGIHLLGFTAVKALSGAQIAWKTENEQNYTHFAVERSSDNGSTFIALNAFCSTTQGIYSYLDKSPPACADRYRLKIEDLNGTVSYSDVEMLMYGNTNNTTANNINVYPNPASSIINIAIHTDDSFSSKTNGSIPYLSQTKGVPSYGIKIINITGMVMQNAISSRPDWQTNVGDLLPGTYLIRVVNSNDNSVVGKASFIKL